MLTEPQSLPRRMSHLSQVLAALETLKKANSYHIRAWIQRQSPKNVPVHSIFGTLVVLRKQQKVKVERLLPDSMDPYEYNYYSLIPTEPDDELANSKVQPNQLYKDPQGHVGRVVYTQTSRSGVAAGVRIGHTLREVSVNQLLEKWQSLSGGKSWKKQRN